MLRIICFLSGGNVTRFLKNSNNKNIENENNSHYMNFVIG